MASTYTPLLGLVVPTTGELAGTWGDVLSAGMTQLVDSAIAGTTTLSADADVTLSTTDGAANQARAAVILWTAANGANTRSITAPSHTKAYIVINAGTGSVIVKGAATTGVTIATGVKALIAWNGSDFVRISSSTVALADITGLGIGVATALAINVGSAGAPVVNGGALGTPSSGSAANLTSFPTLNQNTTGTAAGLSGTPNISVGTVSASGGITSTGGSVTAKKDGSDSEAAGSFLHVTNAADNRTWLWQLSASNNLWAFNYNGTVWSTPFKLTSTGLNSTVIGATTPAAGSFTTLASSTLVPTTPNFKYGYNTSGTYYYADNSADKLSAWILTNKVFEVSSTGLAVTGALSATGILSTSDTTDATSTTAASLKTAGGLAVAKRAYFGDDVYLQNGRVKYAEVADIGGARTISKTVAEVATSSYIDIVLDAPTIYGSTGNYSGILSVACTQYNQFNICTSTVFAVAGYSATGTETSLSSVNGVAGGSSFTVTFLTPSTMRITNTHATACNIVASFNGVVGCAS